MARITPYTQQVFAERSNSSNIELAGAPANNRAAFLRSEAGRMRQSGAKVAAFGDDIMRQREADGQLKAQERFNEFQRNKTTWEQEQKNNRMTNPDGFAKEFDGFMVQSQEEIEEELSNSDSPNDAFDLKYFRQLMDRERTQSFQSNSSWENGMRVQNVAVGTEQNLDGMNSNYSLTRPKLRDLPAQMDAIRTYVNTTTAKVLDPENNYKLAKYGMNNAASVTMDNMLEDDPYALRDVVQYGQGTKDQVIDYVMNVIEGGDQVVDEPNGSIAKFGINGKANGLTDEQVRALTPDAAREIYQTKYFDKRLDKYDPAFKVVAYDAIVNHGNDKNTWAMINQAKGDPYSLIQIRREYYDSLITGNPDEYAKYANGWENRLKTVTAYASNMEGNQEFLQVAGMLDPDILARTQNQLPAAIASKQRQEAAAQEKKVAAFNTQFKNLYDATTTNIEPTGIEEINQLKQLAVNSGDPVAISKAEALSNVRPFVASLKGMSEEQLRTTIRGLSAENNKMPSDDGRLKIEIATGVLDRQIKGIANEGIAYYGRTGQSRMPQPINYGDTMDAQQELRSREDTAISLFQNTGKFLPVLTPDEASSLQEDFKNTPANIFASQLGAFDNLNPKSKAMLAQQIAAKEPALGVAISADDLNARSDIIQGMKIEARYAPADMTASVAEVMDEMQLDPTQRQMAEQAIGAHYRTRAEAENDVSAIVDTNRVRKSVESIFGEIVDLNINGSKVFTFKDPSTNQPVSDDGLYDLFNGMNDQDLQKMFGELPKDILGGTVTADDIKNEARILSAGDGLYIVKFDSVGILPAVGDPNAPLVIDGRKLLATQGGKKRQTANAQNRNPWRM